MIIIPCDTIVRLARLLPAEGDDVEPIFRSMRLENGKAITTNRKFGAVEQLPTPFSGVHHIKLSAALLNICAVEAVSSNSLMITPNPTVGWTSAVTTGGSVIAENIAFPSVDTTTFDRWYSSMVEPCLVAAERANGCMVVDVPMLSQLAASSPSGKVIFESLIDATRTTVLRDANDNRWAGFFMPRLADGRYYPPADVPGWLRT